MEKEVYRGVEAVAFAKTSLRKIRVNSVNWIVEFVDPETGDRWIQTYPDGAVQGGGSPLLQKVKSHRHSICALTRITSGTIRCARTGDTGKSHLIVENATLFSCRIPGGIGIKGVLMNIQYRRI